MTKYTDSPRWIHVAIDTDEIDSKRMLLDKNETPTCPCCKNKGPFTSVAELRQHGMLDDKVFSIVECPRCQQRCHIGWLDETRPLLVP